jgi:hypothetical protein
MGGNTTVIWVIAGIFFVVAIVATIVWWSLADRIYPGASESTGQFIDVIGADGKKTRVPAGTGSKPVVISDSRGENDASSSITTR